jgi:hypothetical protein
MTNKKIVSPCRKFATEKSRYVLGFDFFSTFLENLFLLLPLFLFSLQPLNIVATSTTKGNNNNWTTTTATTTTKYTSESLQGSMVRWPNVSFWAFPDFFCHPSLFSHGFLTGDAWTLRVLRKGSWGSWRSNM